MKFTSDGFHRTVSLEAARRRSAGNADPHVASPYVRTLFGDAEKNRSLWERHPRISDLTGWVIVLGVCAVVWLAVIALLLGVIVMFEAVFL